MKGISQKSDHIFFFFYFNLLLVVTGMHCEKKRNKRKEKKRKAKNKKKKIITRSNISSNFTFYKHQGRQKRSNEIKQEMNVMRNQQTTNNSKAFPLFTRERGPFVMET